MYLKKEIVWHSPQGLRYIRNISRISGRKNFLPQNDTINIDIIDDGSLYRNNEFLIKEGDRIDILVKRVTNNTDTEFTTNDIIWTGIFLDYDRVDTPDNKNITLIVTLLTYEIFNRIWNESYIDSGLKTNEIIKSITKNLSEDISGTGDYSLIFNDVDYPNTNGIQKTRVNGSDFPVIEPIFTQKPMYEWLQEISSPLWTNTDLEIPPVNRRKMIFRIDGNIVKWYYPTLDNISIINKNFPVLQIRGSSTNQESVNYLILECGEDFNGEPIYTYILDQREGAMPIIKERYEHKVSIGGKNTDYQNDFNRLRQKYLHDNTGFIKAVREKAESYADFWFEEFGRAKPIIELTLPFSVYNIGDYIYLDYPKYRKGYYFIEAVGYNLTESEASVILTIKLDDNI